jgi:hypothetical protein
MVDGRLVGKRELAQHEWLITAGRNVAELGFQVGRAGRVLKLRVRDMWSEDVLYDGEFPLASRLAVVEPDAIAVYDPSGKFLLIDVRSGKAIVRRTLEAMNDLHFIQTLRAGNELFLFVSSQPEQQYKPVGQFDYPLVNGLVYALDMQTGDALWPGPAVVRNRGVVLSQPEDIPLLWFAERKMIRDAATGGGSQLRVLCLDKRTGQALYRNERLPDTSATDVRVRSERHPQPVVALEVSTGKIQLTLSDRPRPQQPPANDDLAAPREAEAGGLRGIGLRMSGALRSVLEGESKTPPAATPPQEADDD